MIDDLGGDYHPPHAVLNISYPVETDRPQFSKTFFNISKQHKMEKAPSANLKPFLKVDFYSNFNLFVLSFLKSSI